MAINKILVSGVGKPSMDSPFAQPIPGPETVVGPLGATTTTSQGGVGQDVSWRGMYTTDEEAIRAGLIPPAGHPLSTGYDASQPSINISEESQQQYKEFISNLEAQMKIDEKAEKELFIKENPETQEDWYDQSWYDPHGFEENALEQVLANPQNYNNNPEVEQGLKYASKKIGNKLLNKMITKKMTRPAVTEVVKRLTQQGLVLGTKAMGTLFTLLLEPLSAQGGTLQSKATFPINLTKEETESIPKGKENDIQWILENIKNVPRSKSVGYAENMYNKHPYFKKGQKGYRASLNRPHIQTYDPNVSPYEAGLIPDSSSIQESTYVSPTSVYPQYGL